MGNRWHLLGSARQHDCACCRPAPSPSRGACAPPGDDGKPKIIPEYPEFAWFEGLVNAVAHRDYAHSGDHIRVMMRDDRTEMLSPGKLPNVVTLENMRHTRWARNPVMAGALAGFG